MLTAHPAYAYAGRLRQRRRMAIIGETGRPPFPHPMHPPDTLFESSIPSLPLLGRGKVRDLYDAGDGYLLIVATDRLSAFDVVLPDPVPGKGEVLTVMSNFWFDMTSDLIPNHLANLELESLIGDPALCRSLEKRSVIARRLEPLPIEAVVRGYLIGSGWRDYRATGRVCGIALPAGLKMAAPLPEVIFTPATKAPAGGHDRNISFQDTVKLLGPELAHRVRNVSLAIYERAAKFALDRGIIIADTKFEFGRDEHGGLVIIDEALTPDSSRFWPKAEYRLGSSPPSFDKQFVRDYLDSIGWDRTAPGPHLPAEIIRRTGEKYRQALALLQGTIDGHGSETG